MLISLRRQATMTPKVRALIQASAEPARVLAERHGTTPQTIWSKPDQDLIRGIKSPVRAQARNCA